MPKFALIYFLLLFSFLKGACQTTLPDDYCGDSSYRKYFFIGGDSLEVIGQMDGFNGGLLMLGRHKPQGSTAENGLIVSLDSTAKVIWSRDYIDNDPNEQFHFVRGIKLVSNEYLVAGRITSSSDPYLNEWVLVKADGQGNLVWSKRLGMDPAIDINPLFQVQAICEGFNGETLISGTIYGDLNAGFAGQYGFIMKISPAGDPVFSRLFILDEGTVNDLSSLFLKGNSILAFGTAQDGTCPSLDARAVYSMSINYGDGSVSAMHHYCYPKEDGVMGFANYLQNYEVTETSSGYCFYGFLAESGAGARDFLVVNFDSDGLFVNALTITDHFLGSSFHNLTVDKSGDIFITGVQPAQGLYTSVYTKNGALVSQSKIDFPSFDKLYFVHEGGNKLSVDDNGYLNYLNNAVTDNKSSITLIHEFYKNNFNSMCLGSDTTYPTVVNTLMLDPSPLSVNNIVSDKLMLTDFGLTEQVNLVNAADVCDQVSHCSMLNIEGKDTVCGNGAFSVFKAIKGDSCLQRIMWQYDSSWMDHWQVVNDSVINIYPAERVSASGPYSLKASLNGCQDLATSHQLTILTNGVLHVSAPDLCQGDSIALSPGSYFSAYLWQDGSADSTFVAKNGGEYSVNADYNGCAITDSFLVDPFRENSKVSLGADTTVCGNIRLVLHAGSEFKTYKWQDGSTDSSYMVNAAGKYYVEVTNACDVCSSDTLVIGFTDSCLPVFSIPNAFTPNNDGLNDTFFPIVHGNVQRYEFRVYNRSGMLVFHSTSPGEGWDGNISGSPQPPDGYLWYCRFTLNNKAYFQKGSVVLVR